MAADVSMVAEFYASARGAVVARLLRERLAVLWPDLSGLRVLGLGYAVPYLRLWRVTASRCVALVPSQLGIARWPAGAPNLSCTAEEDALPFADLSFDRVLLVHGIEAAENIRSLLREIWRVLRDDGRIIVIAPNRLGLWAHFENTPFGQGEPYSPDQIGRLLAANLFRIERREVALFLPPLRWRFLLRSGPLIERAGRRLAPRFAGVTLSEAVKDAYAAIPLAEQKHRRFVLGPAA